MFGIRTHIRGADCRVQSTSSKRRNSWIPGIMLRESRHATRLGSHRLSHHTVLVIFPQRQLIFSFTNGAVRGGRLIAYETVVHDSGSRTHFVAKLFANQGSQVGEELIVHHCWQRPLLVRRLKARIRLCKQHTKYVFLVIPEHYTM
jgi:hypothetical protein